jgi:hypothetical protein
MTLNLCQAGHTFHESKRVETEYGPWWIWDWARYMDFPGYCTGQDEVSKSIEVTGWWEKADTDHMLSILDTSPWHGLMLDFGSHIGWFTVLAATMGLGVFAYDADPENTRLLSTNYSNRQDAWVANVATDNQWVATIKRLPAPIENGHDVRFMKVDIEGHEHEALNLTRYLWQQQRVDYGLWELSPIFENREGINAPSYADLVDEIASYGYRWYILKGDDRWYIEGKDLTFPQENAWCERT